MAGADDDARSDDVAREVRAAYAAATWFELARATSEAHHAVERQGARAPGADARRARYAALRAMLDEATENVSTHCLHARL
jgi:hypothetical protein